VGETTELWTAIDDYLGATVLGSDPVLRAALDDAAAAGLPQIQVSPLQGRLLELLARIGGARRVLEVGTLGGYSTICLARSLPPDARLITLELEQRHADVARANLDRAGLAGLVDIRVGAALDTLRLLDAEDPAPFDLVFVDADKANAAAYFDWAVEHAHPGTVIVIDNAVRHGRVIDAQTDDVDVVGTRAVLEHIGNNPRVTATVIQTVGSKGHDGFALAVVDAPAG
jgi:predicted O-methyltransferase YrrM